MDTKYNQEFIDKTTKAFRKLKVDIDMHDRLYYRENNPQISDFEYDCLKSELVRLKQVLKNVGINTEEDKIGNDLSSNFKKRKHITPMQSLANTYSHKELLAFDTRISKQLDNKKVSYVVEPKIDGIAINLIYEHGSLKYALTRGDGIIGDDVTNNILTINQLPIKLLNCPDLIEIRGEVFIDEQTFESENNYRHINGLEEYANPRNLAAGTVKSLDITEVKKRHLQAIFYAIGYSSDDRFATQIEVLEQLHTWQFPSQEYYWFAKDIGEAWNYIKQLNTTKRDFKYWTDGAVLKINELNLHKLLGSTAKAPRWSIAYKFTPTRVSTKLQDIILQVGRTGIVTPVAILSPVEIDGSIVSRATLHNANEITKKDIRIGDYVFLEKAGEIIPAIVSVDKSKRSDSTQPFHFPNLCPSCKQTLVHIDSEVAWRCINPRCPEQIKSKIMYFVSKEAMNINTLGEAIIQQLIESGTICNIADIYKLTYNDLTSLPKLGQKSALKILSNIDESKKSPIWRLINGLGILGVGEQTAKILADLFKSIIKLSTATFEELVCIPGIGNKTAESIHLFFKNSENKILIKQLEDAGLSLYTHHIENKEDTKILNNKAFVLTGTLKNFTRTQAKEIIESLGGNITESVSKKTNIIIIGDNPGSKLLKAEKLGITIWTEEDFINYCHLE